MNKLAKDNWCFKCGGKGFEDKECEACGRKPTRGTLNLEFRDDTNVLVEKIDDFGIPGQYRGIVWNSDVLKKYFHDKESDLLFQKYVAQLEKVNGFFANGMIPPKSAIVIAPAGYSKMIFAYSCMQRALESGFSVAPFLDTIELKRLLTLAGENPNYKLYGKISYDDYVMADICFVTVTKLKQHEWAFETIQELLDRRSRKGLSTFILSRYGLNEISRRDNSNQFDVISSSYSDDNYKYPAVIKYLPV